jgi:UPF0716 protein FxsA
MSKQHYRRLTGLQHIIDIVCNARSFKPGLDIVAWPYHMTPTTTRLNDYYALLRMLNLRFILLLLICLPLLEIAVLIMVGSNIGVLATIALVIFTGFLGSYLLRAQGLSAFSKLRREIDSGRAPDKQLADAAMIMVAGVMLIIPGFISDLIGIALFIPYVRSLIVKSLAGRVTVVRPANRRDQTVVDLEADEYHHVGGDEGKGPNDQSSPWRLPPDKH